MPATLKHPFHRGSGAEDDPIRRVIDRHIPWAIHGEIYSLQAFGTGSWPDHGWKLHVSATSRSAIDILEASLEILIAEGTRFKIANSVDALNALNAGFHDISQIGKFITVYPSDDDHAVRLALALDDATREFRGPRIPSDRPLRPDSLVHYRYGAMRLRPEFAELGETSDWDMLDQAGRLTSDIRQGFYIAPQGIADPFEASGAYLPRAARNAILNDRYIIVDALAQTPRGGVYRAVDLGPPTARVCVLKEFWHDVGHDLQGRDASFWAENEVRLLSRCGSTAPAFFDRFELEGNCYVAMEYIDGSPLDRLMEENWSESGVPPSLVKTIGLATADILIDLHAKGLVYRDFKPAHVITTPTGGYRLIDFGIAYDAREDGSGLPAGTPHFCSPEQFDGDRPTEGDDIFAWGAVMHYIACGEASLSGMSHRPDKQRPFARDPVSRLNPGFPHEIASVIERAVAMCRADRFPTMRHAREALAAASDALDQGRSTRQESEGKPEMAGSPVPLDRGEALRLAREIGDALCGAAEQSHGGLCWTAWDPEGEKPERSPHLYSGAAGIGLFLAELARATGEERYADAARGAARWIAGPVWGRGCAQHGFHGGEPGIAFFFIRLAELLDEPHYVTAAEFRMRRLEGAPFQTEDLLYGTAGTILSLVRLHSVTGDPRYLDAARKAGDELVSGALPAPQGKRGCYWEVTAPDSTMSKSAFLGLLHGAAGIGLALSELAGATDEERYLHMAIGTADLLLALGRRRTIDANEATVCGLESLTGQEALAWPRKLEDKPAGMQAQCHGAGGIAQFFVRLDRVRPDPRYREAARGAANTIAARLDRETQSGLCHGLAGTGNVLLDCYQSLESSYLLQIAELCGRKLQQFRKVELPGQYAMSIDGTVSPDIMLGYAGIGSLMLRLSDPRSVREPILR